MRWSPQETETAQATETSSLSPTRPSRTQGLHVQCSDRIGFAVLGGDPQPEEGEVHDSLCKAHSTTVPIARCP